jgi:hypothetical protein
MHVQLLCSPQLPPELAEAKQVKPAAAKQDSSQQQQLKRSTAAAGC